MNSSKQRRSLLGLFCALCCWAILHASPAPAETVIKFATLAPEGSTWMKAMSEYSKELAERTGGELRFKFYPGGVSGDEKDVVRKMRLGQLQAAGLTGVGLGELAPQVRVLDAPMLLRSHAEVDRVLARFGGELSKALEAKGFVLLGWTEVGFVHLFTNAPVRAPEDLKAVKMWVWEGDPIAESAFEALGVRPISLSITDVMTSLQTGLVNGVYSSPMAALALQWFTKTRFIHSEPLAYAAGAVVVSKKLVDGLHPAERKALLELGSRHMRRLTALGREENLKAMETLRKEGLSLLEPASAESLRRYEQAGARARRELAGRLYGKELLERVEKAVAEFRSGVSKAPARGTTQKP